MPSGKIDKALIKDNRDGTVSIQYEHREEGLHELHIHYNSEHVQGLCKLKANHVILRTRNY
jgi:filamin